MARMWDYMKNCHESQFKLVKNLVYLEIDEATEATEAIKETSDHHRECTHQLFKVVEDWHMQFGSLMDSQKKYIKGLKDWLKLNVIPVESSFREKVSSPPRNENPPIQRLVHAWNESLEKLPHESAKGAIYSFRAVLDAIVQHHVEEMKLKEICEETRRELQRKRRSLEEWRQKSMRRKTPPDEMNPDGAIDDRDMSVTNDKEVAVAALEKKLEEEEKAYWMQCRQGKQKTLVSFRNRLPEVFRALTEFAIAASNTYGALRPLGQPQKQNL